MDQPQTQVSVSYVMSDVPNAIKSQPTAVRVQQVGPVNLSSLLLTFHALQHAPPTMLQILPLTHVCHALTLHAFLAIQPMSPSATAAMAHSIGYSLPAITHALMATSQMAPIAASVIYLAPSVQPTHLHALFALLTSFFKVQSVLMLVQQANFS